MHAHRCPAVADGALFGEIQACPLSAADLNDPCPITFRAPRGCVSRFGGRFPKARTSFRRDKSTTPAGDASVAITCSPWAAER
ncbi:hypothetical protein MRX96_054472 [Rhipicephalus microplus]